MHRPAPEPPPANRPGAAVRILISYNDITSGHRAVRLLVGLAECLIGEGDSRLPIWCLDTLAAVEWRDEGVGKELQAEMAALAKTLVEPLPELLRRWVVAVLHLKRGAAAAVAVAAFPEALPAASDGLPDPGDGAAEPQEPAEVGADASRTLPPLRVAGAAGAANRLTQTLFPAWSLR